MGISLTYLGLLFTASIFDIKTMRVPNIISYLLMLCPPVFIAMIHPNVGLAIEYTSIFLTLALTLPGLMKGVFGAADIKILIGIASIIPFDVMAIYLFITFSIFIVYSTFKYSDKNEAPFVPAVFVSTSLFGLIGWVSI
ncbi:prepilin peptidase [Vibrio furnissii]|uniref:prepilin peptidase n=1 Tax=Vibrio furnissii TaxID=29494 RepID=UPI0012AE412A|nr:prepilin peptidase [Vibrio furnissii]